MRIGLVTPGSPFLLDERVFMSLGILKVAAVLERAGHYVRVLDLSGVQAPTLATNAFCRGDDFDIFGITATSPQMPAALGVLDTIRNSCPGKRVVLGGPHVTLVNAAQKLERRKRLRGRATVALEEMISLFDTLVCGDGEFSVFEALKNDAPKLVDADDPKSALFMTSQQAGETPFPARHLVDVPSYRYFIDGERALSYISALGCPYECGYCGGRFSPFLRRNRRRTPENVVAELRHIYETYGIRGHMDYCDEVNLGSNTVPMMNGIAHLQDELGVEFRLRAFCKAELLTDEQAASMYRAGFRWILVGFEAGDDRILVNINKKATKADNTRCMEIATRHGLKVKALMSIGHPGESPETIENTRRWVLEMRPADFDCTVITTYPGTPYFDEAVESSPGTWTYSQPKTGDKLHALNVDFHRTASYYKGKPGDYVAHTWTDYLTSEDLVRMRDEFEASVRATLKIPYPSDPAALQYDHSMSQRNSPSEQNYHRGDADAPASVG